MHDIVRYDERKAQEKVPVGPPAVCDLNQLNLGKTPLTAANQPVKALG